MTLLAYKCMDPSCVHLVRGNHETAAMNKMYGFDGEVKAKYSVKLADLFQEVFQYLPLAVVLGEKVFVVHGGLFSRDGVTLDDLRKIDRFHEPPDSGEFCEMLWSDPGPAPGRQRAGSPSSSSCGGPVLACCTFSAVGESSWHRWDAWHACVGRRRA